MVEFPANPNRHDPYKSYRFRVKAGADYVLGVSKVSGLKRSTDVVEHREGGDPNLSRKSPGRTKWEPITLERGVTQDKAFEQWANKTTVFGGGSSEVSLADFRKDLIIEVYNEAGQVVLAYKVYRCWVSEYQALPDLDANGQAAVAIQSVKLENEGWERDASIAEPTEPTYLLPA